jgi:hypothetical protein
LAGEPPAGANAGGQELDFLAASHLESVGQKGVFVPHVAQKIVEEGHQIVQVDHLVLTTAPLPDSVLSEVPIGVTSGTAIVAE